MDGGQVGGNGPSVQGHVVEESRLGKENATIQGKEVRFIHSFKPLNITTFSAKHLKKPIPPCQACFNDS